MQTINCTLIPSLLHVEMHCNYVEIRVFEFCVNQIVCFLLSCKKSAPNPNAANQCREIVIHLMACQMDTIRENAYEAILDIVKVR